MATIEEKEDKAIEQALGEFCQNKAITATCPHCGAIMQVDHSPEFNTWTTYCPNDCIKDNLRGF